MLKEAAQRVWERYMSERIAGERSALGAVVRMPLAWAVRQYEFWDEGRRLNVAIARRDYTLAAYRKLWDRYWEIQDSTDPDEEAEARSIEDQMETIENYVTRGPGSLWHEFRQSLPRPPS